MPGPASLRELVNQASARRFLEAPAAEPHSLTDAISFPFLAIVAQREMKLALLLALINPGISGVLLVGPRGTGKTTAVRSLTDLLPFVNRSACPYGCLPEDIETGGWRPINLEREPFRLPPPMAYVDELCQHTNGIYADKRLGVWRLQEIRRSDV